MSDRDTASAQATCPSDETLAAWVDGRLPSAEAEAVEAHVAACGACAELVAALGGALSEVEAAPMIVPRAPNTDSRAPRGWRLIAIAATVALAVGGLALWQTRTDAGTVGALRTLAAAQGPVRTTYGRLHGFEWAAPPPTFRTGSGGTGQATAALLSAADAIDRRYQRAESPETRHARGVALLVAGDVDAAIALLDDAAEMRPGDARFLNDAAVGHLQRAWATSDPGSLREARRLAEAAVTLRPDAPDGWFNLLWAARLGGDKVRAQDALEVLLRLEPAGSGWRIEAQAP